MSDIEWGAVVKGAVPGTILAFAFVIIRTVVEGGAIGGVMFLLTLGAFAAAGVIATNATTNGRAVVHGTIAALLASAIVGLVGIPIRLSRHSELTLGGQLVTLPLFCFIAMSCGIVGAFVADARARSTEPTSGGNPS